MKQVILAAALFVTPIFAFGQTPPPPLPPELEAAQQRVIQLTGDALQWQTQAIALQRQLADLQKQLAAAQAKSQESPK